MSYMSYADRRKKAAEIKQTATMIIIIGTECFQLRLERMGYEDPRIVTSPPANNTSEVHRLHRMVSFLSQEFKDPLDFVPESED